MFSPISHKADLAKSDKQHPTLLSLSLTPLNLPNASSWRMGPQSHISEDFWNVISVDCVSDWTSWRALLAIRRQTHNSPSAHCSLMLAVTPTSALRSKICPVMRVGFCLKTPLWLTSLSPFTSSPHLIVLKSSTCHDDSAGGQNEKVMGRSREEKPVGTRFFKINSRFKG